ncbi:MAG TPA: MFS transporter [Candidatus Ruania gallistercoris]|uniref:MFS transporter n=1 Tax=Candidatus Ruania gallistercoris TaxID=2838746 RepID=A0A9D2EF13_9MICO|nr:MFS transporter [Candidatus Ruania gallistercoris]
MWSDLRTVAVHSGFRRLFAVRLVSQCGDGMFQAGLATLFFFSPENLATAGAVAAAFAVLLLPFTIVGPFAGPLLDRWRRRQVLLFGNGVRVVLTLLLAVLMAVDGVSVGVYVLALVTLGVNRFLLAALSAALPRVVPREQLLIANALTPTLGAVAAVVGAGIGFGLGLLLPPGPMKDGVVLAVAAALFGGASALALRLGKDQLGPEARPSRTGLRQAWGDLRATAVDLGRGARYLVLRGTPGAALSIMALHRFLYGVNFIALILISRNLLVDPTDAAAGLAMFGLLTGISFAGNGLAIILTPLAHERMSPSTWVVLCLGLGGISQVLMGVQPTFAVIAAAAVLMGLAVQGAKIAVDTIVQADTDDAYRGRAFSLYDTLYNGAFAGAAALAAAVLPDTGYSRPTFFTLAAVYVVLSVGYRLIVRRLRDQPREVSSGRPSRGSGDAPSHS